MSDGLNDNVWEDEDSNLYHVQNEYVKKELERCKELLSEILISLKEQKDLTKDPRIIKLINKIENRNIL